MGTSIHDILTGHDKWLHREVTVKGWVRARRDSKAGLSFVHIHDGSGFATLQIIANNKLANYETQIINLTAGCAVICTGTVVESQGQGQRVEVHARTLEVIGWVEDPETYPISPKQHTFEHLRDYAHLRVRTNTLGAVARLRHLVSHAIHDFYHERGFFWVHTPIITTNDCEGAGELFQVSTLDLMNLPRTDTNHVDFEQDFFGERAYLAVSGQLNVESYCLALSKVYTFGPTFRAENSNTSRHLAEFWMIEPEIAFANLNDNATLAEDFLKFIFSTVLEQGAEDLAFFAQRIDPEAIQRLESVVNSEFVQMDYTQAIRILQKVKQPFVYPIAWGTDLHSEHERYLTETHVGQPVIITNYPKGIKAFYMRLNDDEQTVAAMDVLAPGIGEIIGGSQREERLDVLDTRLEEQGLKESLWWYRDLRRYGTVPHAGFGMGLERVLNYITGLQNIREVVPFPRAPRNARF